MVNYEGEEQRKFERFSVDFEILIYASAASGKKLIDTSTVNDISGGGISFASNKPELYTIGQAIEIAIHLPDCEAFDAYMRSLATVVRISNAQPELATTTAACIGIQVDDELAYQSVSK